MKQDILDTFLENPNPTLKEKVLFSAAVIGCVGFMFSISWLLYLVK